MATVAKVNSTSGVGAANVGSVSLNTAVPVIFTVSESDGLTLTGTVTLTDGDTGRVLWSMTNTGGSVDGTMVILFPGGTFPAMACPESGILAPVADYVPRVLNWNVPGQAGLTTHVKVYQPAGC